MNRFYIVCNREKNESLKLAEKIQDYLKLKGCHCDIAEPAADNHHQTFRYTNPDKVPADVQCILVIGGDGTLLQTARDLQFNKIPMLGFNTGTLGYLAEIDPPMMEDALDNLITNRFHIEKRMLLEGTVYKNGKVVVRDCALNEILISRSSCDVAQLAIYVDGVFLTRYVADGIILSTPTGSTAYNLSAGGPLVDPKSKIMVMTPVAPHSLQNRSIVLSPYSSVVVEAEQKKGKAFIPVEVSFDGNQRAALELGDKIKIEQANVTFDLIKISHDSFLDAVRRKMADR